MCGITGFLGADPRAAVLSAMTETLHHRGPDDSGLWLDQDAGIALGHRRLSIIDLSAAAHQPMLTRSGRFVISYNGEIYNYAELAAELAQAGVSLRSRSDTEVLIEGFARWGIAETLRLSEGMFAFALWDRERRELTLARDRLGIKPLYWGQWPGLLVFGSELKPFHAHAGAGLEIDGAALASYLRLGYVPAPASIYRSVRKLEPGTILTAAANREPRIERYWDLGAVARAGCAAPVAREEEMLAALDAALRRAVRSEMVADVPLGAFLSGGIDSSLVTAVMQAQSRRPVKTFTIGFAGIDDEARHAKAVAAHLGTDHTEFYVEEETARNVIPFLPLWYDEPLADASQIPTQVVSRLARRHVTVALSGDGGDEMFAGYTRYAWGRSVGRAIEPWPPALRRALGPLFGALPQAPVRSLAGLAPARWRPALSDGRLAKLGALLAEPSADAAYRSLVSLWPDPNALLDAAAPTHAYQAEDAGLPDLTHRMMLQDMSGYLPDDVLAKVDRASMSVGLEVRVPLLNHRVVELAWQMPLAMKLRGGVTKWALRQLLYRHVPAALIDRAKQGFTVPLGAWLRGPLREWAGDLLSRDSLKRGALLKPEPIARVWHEHLAGKRDWSARLWAVLMLQSWLADTVSLEHPRGAGRPDAAVSVGASSGPR